MPSLGTGMLSNHLKQKQINLVYWTICEQIKNNDWPNLRSNGVHVVDRLLVHYDHPKVGQVEHQPLLNLNNVTTISDIQAEH